MGKIPVALTCLGGRPDTLIGGSCYTDGPNAIVQSLLEYYISKTLEKYGKIVGIVVPDTGVSVLFLSALLKEKKINKDSVTILITKSSLTAIPESLYNKFISQGDQVFDISMHSIDSQSSWILGNSSIVFSYPDIEDVIPEHVLHSYTSKLVKIKTGTIGGNNGEN